MKRRRSPHWLRALTAELLGALLLVWLLSNGWVGGPETPAAPGTRPVPSRTLARGVQPAPAANWLSGLLPPPPEERIAYTQAQLEQAAGAVRAAIRR